MGAQFTPGPLTVQQDQSWPYRIHILARDGEKLETHDRWAHSTAQRSLEDCLNAVGFKAIEAEGIRARLQRQLADAHLRAAAPELYEALEEFCLAAEYGAGCDEGVAPEAAETEIMSWAGSPMAVAYSKARALQSKARGETPSTLNLEGERG